MNLVYTTVAFLLRKLLPIFYRFRVYGQNKNLPGAALIAPNHASFLDPPVIAAAWPQEVHFLARASLFQGSFWGWFLKALNAHPIDGSAQDLASFRIICTLLREGKKVVLFPEGVRSEDGSLTGMKAGVAMLSLKTGCPIIPVYIHGAFTAWPRHSRWPKLRKPISCIFGDPIFPPSLEGRTKKEAQLYLTRELEMAMKKLQETLGSVQ